MAISTGRAARPTSPGAGKGAGGIIYGCAWSRGGVIHPHTTHVNKARNNAPPGESSRNVMLEQASEHA